MGGAVSAGRNNNELVEKLVRAKYLRSPHIQRVFRAVDRADYFLPAEKEHAYIDLAWKCGLLHISAPCIYCDVIEGLKLKPGLSFLNLGSGTGYLSTMAGLILGTNGINHGIELHKYVVDYARERLEEFILHSPAMDEFDFCEPKFVVGNCLCLPQNTQLYDRVYCGAACPKEHEYYIKRLVKIGGIIVMPLDDYLLKIKRISDNEWISKQLMHVSFTTLVSPEDNEKVEMPDTVPASLQEICRTSIRKVLHQIIARENPLLVDTLMKSVSSKTKHKPNPNHTKTFCIAIEDEDSDSEEFNRIHNLDLDSGSREMNALLRLVLSMGNRTRDVPQNEMVTISNSNTSDSNVSSIDEQDYSSDGMESSSDNEDNDDLIDKAKKSDTDMELEDERWVKPGTSKTQQTKSELTPDNKENAEENSVSMEDACENDNAVNSNPLSSECSDCKRIKVDSGITGDASTTTEYNSFNSSSINDPSDFIEMMDTNSSEENFDDTGNSENRHDAEWLTHGMWCARKRHHANQETQCQNEGDSTDSDSDEGVVTQSKIKRKSPLPPNPYDGDRIKLSELMRDKVHMLPLPPLLIKFVNMNRDPAV